MKVSFRPFFELLSNLNLPSSACCVTSCFSFSFHLLVSEMYAVWHQIRLHQKKGLFGVCLWVKHEGHMHVEANILRLSFCPCCDLWDYFFPFLASVCVFWPGDTLRALCWHFFSWHNNIIHQWLCSFARKYFLLRVKSAQQILSSDNSTVLASCLRS